MKEICGMTLQEVREMFKAWGESEFRAGQIFAWIYKKGVVDFERMSNLPESLRERMAAECVVLAARRSARQESADGTVKLLLKLGDGKCVEAVAIPEEKRLTGCVSSQVGCAFACRFCASGMLGFQRNLTCAEIVNEVLLLKENFPSQPLTHLVFMGTGEPLENYEAVLKSIRIINAKEAVGIGARRITISTAGVIPGIKRLAQEKLQVELSVSLHAADDRTRSQLMPINKRYPLKELIACCGQYYRVTKRQVTFEYIMIKGINSSLQDARVLSKILAGFDAKVNLIPANPVTESVFVPPNKVDVLVFRDQLVKSGIPVTLRKERGTDIDAACGQLRLRHEKNKL
jgi:23S rRNA (adenine2503-C2)-methyltransferase